MDDVEIFAVTVSYLCFAIVPCVCDHRDFDFDMLVAKDMYHCEVCNVRL